MRKNIEQLIQDFINDSLFLKEYSEVGTLARDGYDPKLTIKIGKKINTNIKTILQSDSGIEKFKLLLKNENGYIKFLAARYLYPLMEKEAMKIMIDYKKSLVKEIDILEVDTIINGIKKGEKIFMSQFNEIYGKQMY